MSTILDKIAEIESEMARTQKNKATAGHLGMLKAKLAKLRYSTSGWLEYPVDLLGDPSDRLKPLGDLVLTVLAAGGPLL